MLTKDLKNQLKNVKEEIAPDKAWVKNNRDLLLSQIKNTVNTEEINKEKISLNNVWSSMSIFIPNRVVYGVVRPVAVFALVLIVTSSGWVASVGASQNALPGDWLYTVKISAEKTKIAAATLIGSKKAETQYRVEAAVNRAHEVQEMVKSLDPEKKTLAVDTISNLNKTISEVNKNLDEIKTDSKLTNSGDVVKAVAAQTSGISLALKDAQTNLLTAAQSSVSVDNQNKVLVKELAGAKEAVKNVEEKTVEVAVAKHLNGDTSITPTDVVNLVDNSLQKALNDTVQSAQNIQAVDKAVSLAKPAITGSTTVKTINTINNTSADLVLVDQLGQKIEEVASKTQEANKQAQAASGAIEQRVNEVKQMLSGTSSLNSVLDKLKEVNNTAATAEKASTEALTSIKEVLPAVKVVPAQNSTSGLGIELPVLSSSSTLNTKTVQ